MENIEKTRRFRKRLITAIGVTTALIVLIPAVMIFGLRVRNFDVDSKLPYSKEEIIAGTRIVRGTSFFKLDIEEAERNLEKTLPFTDNVKITKKLSGTVVVRGEKSKEVYSVILSNGIYALTNEDTKILEVSSVAKPGTIIVKSLISLTNYTIGERVNFGENGDSVTNMLAEVSNAIDENEFSNIELINIEDYNNIYLIYQSRIIIKIGTVDEINRKLALAAKSISEENKLSSSQFGVLDVSPVSKAVFTPKDYKEMPDLIEFCEFTEEMQALILSDDDAENIKEEESGNAEDGSAEPDDTEAENAEE